MSTKPVMDHARRLEIVALARQAAMSAKPKDERPYALEEVAWAYAELGMPEQARDLAHRIRMQEVRGAALSYVCDCFAKSGDREPAFTLARRMEHPEARAQAWGRIARHLPEDIVRRNALDAIERIDRPYAQTCQIVVLAEATCDRAYFDRAIAMTGDLESDNQLSEAYYQIAEAQMRCGMLEDARETARAMPPDEGDDIFVELVRIHASSGNHARALKLVREIYGLFVRISASIELHEMLPDAGLLSDASDLLNRSQPSTYRYVEACAALAVSLNDIDLISKALAIASSGEQEFDASGDLAEIAEAQARMGMLDAAMETLNLIDAVPKRIFYMARSGDQTRSIDFANAALALAATLEGDDLEEASYDWIASAYARCGEFGKALDVARRDDRSLRRSFAMQMIAREQCESGAIDDALATAADIERDWGRVMAYLEIAGFEDVRS